MNSLSFRASCVVSTLVLVTFFSGSSQAAPSSIGIAAASSMMGADNSTHILAWAIPAVCITFAILALAACTCSLRQRTAAKRPSYNPSPRQSHYSPFMSTQNSPKLAQRHRLSVRIESEDHPPPPYEPSSDKCHASASPPISPYDGPPLGSEELRIFVEDEEGRQFLTAPSPIVSRTGSPSLQIWTPPSTPPPPRPAGHW